jgi:hypothetical protein
MLEKVAKVLGVPEEAIKSFNEEAAINIISSTEKEKNELLQKLLDKK